MDIVLPPLDGEFKRSAIIAAITKLTLTLGRLPQPLEVERACGLPHATFYFHLKKLRERGRVVTVRTGDPAYDALDVVSPNAAVEYAPTTVTAWDAIILDAATYMTRNGIEEIRAGHVVSFIIEHHEALINERLAALAEAGTLARSANGYRVAESAE